MVINEETIHEKIVMLASIALDKSLLANLKRDLRSVTIKEDKGEVVTSREFGENYFPYRVENDILIIELSYGFDT